MAYFYKLYTLYLDMYFQSHIYNKPLQTICDH